VKFPSRGFRVTLPSLGTSSLCVPQLHCSPFKQPRHTTVRQPQTPHQRRHRCPQLTDCQLRVFPPRRSSWTFAKYRWLTDVRIMWRFKPWYFRPSFFSSSKQRSTLHRTTAKRHSQHTTQQHGRCIRQEKLHLACGLIHRCDQHLFPTCHPHSCARRSPERCTHCPVSDAMAFPAWSSGFPDSDAVRAGSGTSSMPYSGSSRSALSTCSGVAATGAASRPRSRVPAAAKNRSSPNPSARYSCTYLDNRNIPKIGHWFCCWFALSWSDRSSGMFSSPCSSGSGRRIPVERWSPPLA